MNKVGRRAGSSACPEVKLAQSQLYPLCMYVWQEVPFSSAPHIWDRICLCELQSARVVSGVKYPVKSQNSFMNSFLAHVVSFRTSV